jgi:hypothetical protein
VVAELDRTDPGWRLEEIEARRKVVPEERNSMQKVRAAVKVLNAVRWPSREAGDRFRAVTATSPRRLAPNDAAYLRAELEKVAPALAEARLIDQYPEGRTRIVWSRKGAGGTSLPEHQDVRVVVNPLYWDAVLQADRGDIGAAIRSCNAIFNCCRIFRDDPIVISQLIRIAIARIGVAALEGVLAQGEAEAAVLEKLQTVIAEEAAEPRLTVAARGERGSVHWFMSALAAGDVPTSDLSGAPSAGLSRELSMQLSSSENIRTLHAELLRQLTRWVAATHLPMPDQASWARGWELAQDGAGKELLRSLAESARAFADSTLSVQSRLNSTLAALAVERYRLAQKAWPPSLESLVPTYLTRVPLDPFDGKPLRYRRAVDDVLIYSIGPDHTDNKGALDRSGRAPKDADIGFELWNARQRGQAASKGDS